MPLKLRMRESGTMMKSPFAFPGGKPNLGPSVSARDRMATSRFLRTSALLGAEEAVEHLLQAVDLTLVDVPAGLDPISEHRRTQT